MRDPKRIDTILALIAAAWRKYPDLRLMQLLAVVIQHGGDHFYVEDDELEKRLHQRIREWGVQLELPSVREEEGTDG